MQELAGVAHDDVDPFVFSVSDDEQNVRSCIFSMQTVYQNSSSSMYTLHGIDA